MLVVKKFTIFLVAGIKLDQTKGVYGYILIQHV